MEYSEDEGFVETEEDSPHDQLIEAVRRCHLDAATLLVEIQKVDINQVNSAGITPLYLSMTNKHIPMVRMLLENRADVNLKSYCQAYCTYETPIETAARLQNLELVEMILAQDPSITESSDDGKSALQWAASSGNLTMAEVLLEHGADVNWIGRMFNTALHFATISDKSSMVRWLLNHGAEVKVNVEGRSSLHIAAVRGNKDIVSSLVENGCWMDSKDNFNFTPLSLACLRGHIDIVRFLIEKCPEDLSFDLNDCLQRSAEGGHVEVVELLLDKGAEINSTNNSGETALSIASKSQFLTVMNLLENGAKINCIDNRGYAPLQHALIRDQGDIAALLIQHGAYLHTETSETDSPLRIAFSMSNPVLVKYMIQAGCHLNKEPWFNLQAIKEKKQELEFQVPGPLRFQPETGRQKQIWEWVEEIFGQTRSLIQMTRIVIREQLMIATGGCSILHAVETLPLPNSIKCYLTLSDINGD